MSAKWRRRPRPSVFRDPGSSFGFVTSIPVTTFADDVAKYVSVPQSSIRVWHRIGEVNATFVVNGPESRTAFDKISADVRGFAARLKTSSLAFSGGGAYAKLPASPPDSKVPKWAIALGVCGALVVVVAVAAIVAIVVRKKRAASQGAEAPVVVVGGEGATQHYGGTDYVAEASYHPPALPKQEAL